MHVSDWLPTLYSAAGGDIRKLGSNLDGVDQWRSLVYDEKSPRRQLLVNIDEREKTAALIIDDWKLIVGMCPLNTLFTNLAHYYQMETYFSLYVLQTVRLLGLSGGPTESAHAHTGSFVSRTDYRLHNLQGLM
jgi:arylsulfatase A-like enzyme